MPRTRKRLQSRAESTYRTRMVRGARVFTSRSQIDDDLAIVVKRYPSRGTVIGPNFVLVHGIGMSSRYFAPLAAELARHGSVWTIDLPGYGSAPNPRRDVTIDDHAAVLAAFLESGRIGGPVLIGHSMGCQVIAALAVANPGVTDRIVLMAPAINPAERTVAFQALRLAQDALVEPPRANWVVFSDYLFRSGPLYFLRQMHHMLADAIEARLPGIAAKTLVIVGDHDAIVPTDWAEEVTRLLPNGTLRVVRGPHVIMFTDPVAIAAHIAEHCE